MVTEIAKHTLRPDGEKFANGPHLTVESTFLSSHHLSTHHKPSKRLHHQAHQKLGEIMKRIHHKKLSNNKLGHRARQKRERFRNMWADDIFLCLINGCVGVRRAISAWSERFHYDQPICIAINYQRGMFRLPSAVAGISAFELIRLGCGWFRRKRRDEIAKCEATFANNKRLLRNRVSVNWVHELERQLEPSEFLPTHIRGGITWCFRTMGHRHHSHFITRLMSHQKGGSCRPTLEHISI